MPRKTDFFNRLLCQAVENGIHAALITELTLDRNVP